MKIAVLGAGAMGPVLAEQLLKAGHEVLVYNQIISKANIIRTLGAEEVLSPTEAIYKADASIIVVSDTSQLRKLLLEETDRRAFDGKALLNGSVTKPEDIIDIALVVKESGGRFSTMSIMSDSGQPKNKFSDFIEGTNIEDKEFWTDLFIQALPDPTLGGDCIG